VRFLELGQGSGAEKGTGEEGLAPGSEGARPPGEPCLRGLCFGEVWGLRGGRDARGGNLSSAPLDQVAQRLQQQATHKCPSASRTATREVSLQSATKWGRRCDYCGQHLENIRSAPTSSVLCQTFFLGVVSKLLGFLMMPSLCGLLLFEHWEFSIFKKMILLSGNCMPTSLTAGQNCFPHSLIGRVVKHWNVLLNWAVECHCSQVTTAALTPSVVRSHLQRELLCSF
uniref:Uncharacterized protein n=1 Tax=Capra hircus TaxID=9925 RepID=A0A8C2SKR4_CAPHI